MEVLYFYAVLLLLTGVSGKCANSSTDDNLERISSSFTKEKVTSNSVRSVVAYTPPMLVIGKENGEISRCLYDQPSQCEVYHRADAAVTATLPHGEFLYAALSSGVMLRCDWQRKHSCQVFNKVDRSIDNLAIAAGHIYAGSLNKTLWRCSLNTPDGCCAITPPHPNTGSRGYRIAALAASPTHIYIVVKESGDLMCCPIADSIDNCQLTPNDSMFIKSGISVTGNIVSTVSFDGTISNFTHSPDGLTLSESITYNPPEDGLGLINKAMVARGHLHVLHDEGLVRIFARGDADNFKDFARYDGAKSLSFAYGTHQMRTEYRAEEEPVWRGSLRYAPPAFHYEIQHRWVLEVVVKDNKLYDSRGAAVDTGAADVGQSGRAAIFALGADGQLLLSNLHGAGSVTAASLFAGNAVAGVGEMVVDNGTITKIMSCSKLYLPDRSLNLQVVEALHSKGYVGAGTIPIEDCVYDIRNLGNTV